MAKHIINISGYIGDAGFFGGDYTDLSSVQAQYNAKPKNTTEIEVQINSGGGDVTQGFAQHDFLASLPEKVSTIVLGLCGSIATVIAQAPKTQNNGGLRKMYKNSDYFIHNPSWSPQSGDPLEAEDLQRLAADLANCESKLLNFYEGITGQSADTLQAKMQAAQTISSTEAKDLGFIDEVITTNIQAASVYKFAAHISKPNYMNPLLKAFEDFKTEIKALVKPQIKNEVAKAEDGSNLYYTGTFGVGTNVFSDEAMTTPAKDGDYVVDGTTWTVSGGAITQMQDKKAEDINAAKVVELEAKVKEAEGAVVAKVAEAVALKETELTAKFDKKFEDFKATIFTGDKIKPEILQEFKNEGGVGSKLDPKSDKAKVLAYRKEQAEKKAAEEEKNKK